MWAGAVLLTLLSTAVLRAAEGQEEREWVLGEPLQPDSFYLNPQGQVVDRGSVVTLECVPRNLSGTLAVVWAFIDPDTSMVYNVITNSTDRGYFLIPHEVELQATSSWTDLVIPSVADRHETGYQCLVFLSGGGRYYSDVAEIVIYEQASLNFPDQFTDVVTTVGATVSIPIEVAGKPVPTVTLQKMVDGLWTDVQVTRFKVNSTLISISSAKETDSGEYRLVLSNRDLQATTYEFSITVEGATTGSIVPGPAQEIAILPIAVGASVGACLLIAVVAITIVVVVIVQRNRRTSSFSPREDTDEESGKVQPSLQNISQGYNSPIPTASEVSFGGYYKESPSYFRHVMPTVKFPIDVEPQWMVPHQYVKLKNVLSENAHMTIFKGTMTVNDEHYNRIQSVAAKTVKDPSNEGDLEDLFHEMQLMSKLAPHPNVMKLLGVITQGPQYMLLMECMTHGDLMGFLRATRSFHGMYSMLPGCGGDTPCPQVTSQDLLRIAVQVAKGMSFLEENKVVHKALCTRNVLVGSNMQVKVVNYSSRNPEKCRPANYYKWMAPETFMDNVFDNRSDVWSFGVTLWEIVTIGGCPYKDMSANALLQNLQNGYKLLQPKHVSSELHCLMLSCWDTQTPKRPCFSQLSSQLSVMCESQMPYIDLRMYDSEEYSEFDDLQPSISTL